MAQQKDHKILKYYIKSPSIEKLRASEVDKLVLLKCWGQSGSQRDYYCYSQTYKEKIRKEILRNL